MGVRRECTQKLRTPSQSPIKSVFTSAIRKTCSNQSCAKTCYTNCHFKSVGKITPLPWESLLRKALGGCVWRGSILKAS